MPAYAWRGRNSLAQPVSGVLDAMTESAAADQLVSMGITPLHLELATDRGAMASATPAPGTWRRQPVVEQDILIFSRQMYSLNKAGVPMLRALAGLQASASKPAMVELLKDLRASLDQGRELSVALGRHVALFGNFFIAMVRVGEMTGRLAEVFLRLAEHLEFESSVRSRIRQAMRYPTFVLIAMAAALVILNLFVLPVFGKVFASLHHELPLLTRVLLGFSAWMLQWWPALLALVAAAIVGVRAYVATPQGRLRWDTYKLRLPVVGDIIAKACLARFARSFALSSQSGVPVVQALTVVAQTADNAYVGARIAQMRDGIERGDSMSRCAAATGVFTPVVLQMIAVGEETGELDALLFEVADMYERETDFAIKGLATAVEPLLLALMGGLVLLLALGVFLPLWSLGEVAMGAKG
ncbi:MAG: type II secretion system F family protein [Rhodoferax sp.]|nr:type II secretion system F family protein [Rhodoferax sp.]